MFILGKLNIMKQLWKGLNFYIPRTSHFPLLEYRGTNVLMETIRNITTMQLYVRQLQDCSKCFVI